MKLFKKREYEPLDLTPAAAISLAETVYSKYSKEFLEKYPTFYWDMFLAPKWRYLGLVSDNIKWNWYGEKNYQEPPMRVRNCVWKDHAKDYGYVQDVPEMWS